MSVDEEGCTALFRAAYLNDFAKVQELLELAKRIGILEALVDKTDNEGDTPLAGASYRGHTQIVRLLLDNKSTIDKVARMDWTPLMNATLNRKSETVSLLVYCKADVNFANRYGSSALHIASEQGNLEIVKILVSAGAKIDQKSILGYTSLHTAAQCNRHEVVDYMLKQPIAKSIINDQSYPYGHTPLIIAVLFSGDLEMVKLLVSRGSDTIIKSGEKGKTLKEWAKEKDKNDIVEYINLYCDEVDSFGLITFKLITPKLKHPMR